MTRVQSFSLYLMLAIVAAGIFGAVHDQISYTVAPEYYTKFKFLQFGLLNTGLPERLRVAQVGFLASWWMGIPLGLCTGAGGFIHRTPAQMRQALLWSLVVITGFTLVFALCGLAYGFFQTRNIDLAIYADWYVPAHLLHLRRFLCAGYMHNAAYLGGVLAIPVAWLFHFGCRWRFRRAP